MRQFEEVDTLVQIRLVCILVPFDILQAPSLLIAPLRRHVVEEGCIDPSIQLIDIHRVHPPLETVVFGLEPPQCGVMLLLLVRVAGQERGSHPSQDLIVESQLIEDASELGLDHLLTYVRLRTFPLEAGAMVIDVSLLFDLADEGATAVSAGD